MAGVSPRRFPSPLRYPGGKGKISNYIKLLMMENDLVGSAYVEPFAGGASVALDLLYEEYASHIYINDLDYGVAAFWRSALSAADELCELIESTPVTIGVWHEQREVHRSSTASDLELGFSTFFLNRTNRSGIVTGGVIGGTDQSGRWKIDARYNSTDLCRRIRKISRFSSRISFTQMDAEAFLDVVPASNRLIYLDPPYYVKGAQLYTNWYSDDDHSRLARKVDMLAGPWMVSYDASPRILEFYGDYEPIVYALSYSASRATTGREVLYMSDDLTPPRTSKVTGIRAHVVDQVRSRRAAV